MSKEPPSPHLTDIRRSILAHLAPAIEAATRRLHASSAGQSVFNNDADLKATLALVRLLPAFLDEMRNLEGEARAAQHNAEIEAFKNCRIPLIPKCQICGAGPGAHWTEDCPKHPNPKPRRNVLDD